ncbi:FKBP-type peptidyl-prolyl cis-trans isomerase [Scrofimicrobium sp. R131]|uniref:peptidylprolyl isomerase n=1 Tax=Scrofimicrobium appendicitidis TaxID=3079930 RepID=A0AAU7VA20_9ACTO
MSRSRLAGAIATLGLLATLGLSGCAGQGGDSASESADQPTQSAQSDGGAQSGAAAEEGPEVDRDPSGSLPTITLPTEDSGPLMKPVSSSEPKVITAKTLTEGDGDKVGPDDFITVNYAGFLWDGKQFDSSYKSDGKSTPISFSLNQVIKGWKWGLNQTRVGDQVMLVIPPEYGYGKQANGQIPANSTLVFYVEILDTVPVNTDALKDAENTNAQLPVGISVQGDLGTEPEVIFADKSPMPEKAETIVLAQGTGPVITDADSVEYYAIVGYWGSSERAHTWEDGIQTVNPGSILVGERVGSRILIITPSADQANPASFTLVDVLAAHPSR